MPWKKWNVTIELNDGSTSESEVTGPHDTIEGVAKALKQANGDVKSVTEKKTEAPADGKGE